MPQQEDAGRLQRIHRPHHGHQHRLPAGHSQETRQSLTNLRHILEEAGYTLGDVAKTTVLLQDIGDFAAMNAVYAGFFTSGMPARVCYQVAALPMGALVEIDAVAAK